MNRLFLTAICGAMLVVSACNSQDSAAAAQQAAAAAEAAAQVSIRAVLSADAATASITDVTARAGAMRAIDLTGCPQEFSVAYIKHVGAWERSAQIENALAELNSRESALVTVGASFISKQLGIGATPIVDHLRESQRLSALRQEAANEVSLTFNQVEAVARAFGVLGEP